MQSNVQLEVLDIFNHIDSRVAIVVADGTVGYNGALHLFMTNDTLASWLAAARAEHPEVDFRYVEDFLGVAVHFVLRNEMDGLAMHTGFSDTALCVARADLAPIADCVASFCTMASVGNGRMTMGEAAQQLADKTVFFVGEMPTENQSILKRNTVHGRTTVQRERNGTPYEAVAAFLTHQSAAKFAQANVPISSCTLAQLSKLWNGLYPIIIEPERGFGVEVVV